MAWDVLSILVGGLIAGGGVCLILLLWAEFSPDGRTLATAGSGLPGPVCRLVSRQHTGVDGRVRHQRPAVGLKGQGPVGLLRPTPLPDRRGRLLPDGKRAVSGAPDETLLVWQLP